MSKALWTIVLIAIGAVFGPMLFGLGNAVVASQRDKNSISHDETVARLLSAYKSDQIGNEVMYTIDFGDSGRECGYEPDSLFDENDRFNYLISDHLQYSDYHGYNSLYIWKFNNELYVQEKSISDFLRETISPFRSSILADCIDLTVLSEFCMRRLRNTINHAGHSNIPLEQNEQRSKLMGIGAEIEVICRFIDGVAARRGIPLVARHNSGS